MTATRANVFAAMRLWGAQLVAFSALGWLVAGILDAVGAFRLSDALVVSGLVMGVITGLVAFQGSDRPLMRVGPILTVGKIGVTDRIRPGAGELPSGARALAVVSAGVAAAGLIAAGVVVG